MAQSDQTNSLRRMFRNYVSIKSTGKQLPLSQRAGKAERMATAGSRLMRVKPTPTVFDHERICSPSSSRRNAPSRRFLGESVRALAASDANRGSGGGREGHLRAAVVVQLTRARAAYHSSVGVSSSVRVSVPETPDVALWADRRNRVESGLLNAH